MSEEERKYNYNKNKAPICWIIMLNALQNSYRNILTSSKISLHQAQDNIVLFSLNFNNYKENCQFQSIYNFIDVNPSLTIQALSKIIDLLMPITFLIHDMNELFKFNVHHWIKNNLLYLIKNKVNLVGINKNLMEKTMMNKIFKKIDNFSFKIIPINIITATAISILTLVSRNIIKTILNFRSNFLI